MWPNYSARPSLHLRPYVRAYAQRKVEKGTADIVQPYPAALESLLNFEFGNSPNLQFESGYEQWDKPVAIVGPQTSHRAWVRLKSPVESFAIFFQPLGVWQLFRVPSGLLVNQHHIGEDVTERRVLELWHRLVEVPCFEERVRIVESYLLARLANIAVPNAIMRSAAYIYQHHGNIRVADIAASSGLSVRHFERRFQQEIGMAPKLFARITRYQRALDAKLTSPRRAWLEIAHRFGYHDEMHMIKDFASLSGNSPGGIVGQLLDLRPPALAANLDQGDSLIVRL